MSMQFMCQKSFHPASKENQRKLWIAQQKAEDDQKREKERFDELEKQRVYDQHRKKYGNSKTPIEELGFLYQPPPGMEKKERNDAAPIEVPNMVIPSIKNPIGPALPEIHPKDALAHEILKNAPKEGEYVDKLGIKNFRPLGVKIRHVRCARCGMKGHASGDRECPMADKNPLDVARKRAEDPMAAQLNIAVVNPYSNNLVLKDYIRKDQLGDDSGLIFEGVEEDSEEDPEKVFLKSLSKKEKKKLLRALEKQEKKDKHKKKEKHTKKKHKHRKKPQKRERDGYANDNEEPSKKKHKY